MAGFFSGYKPNLKKVQKPCSNLKLRKKLEIDECTDNPPLRRSSFLTDDDSEKDFQSLDISNYSTNIDNKKMVTILDEENKENGQEIADTVIDSMCTRVSGINVGSSKQVISENVQVADTIIDSMCSRVSGINVETNQGLSESLDFGLSKKLSVPDTVLDSHNSSRALQEIVAQFPSRRSLFRTRKDSSSSEEYIKGNNVSIKKSFRTPNPKIADDNSDEEVIQVLDTDEEQDADLLQPVELNSHDSYVNCSSTAATLDDFFNNPPLLPSNVGVTHAMVKPYQGDEENELINTSIPFEVGYKNSNITFRQSRKISEVRKTTSFHNVEHVEIGPTDESDVENDDIVDLTLDESGPEAKANQTNGKLTASKSHPISLNIETDTPASSCPKHRNITNINIKFDLKISIRDGSASECSENESVSSEISSVKGDYLKAISSAPNIEPKSTEVEYNTPTRKKEDMMVIDKELQSMLHDLYGNDWKTPQVMNSFKIKKFREELRKSLATRNFESFVGNLANDLESTRISSPKKDTPIKKRSVERKPQLYSNKTDESLKKTQLSTNIRTPINSLIKERESSKKKIGSTIKPTQTVNRHVPKTPLHVLCDPDTESENSSSDHDSDDDFNPDDTWNASSDEEYQSEKDRIKKRQSIKQSDMIFTLDDSLNDILKKYEFKPQPQIEVVEKPARRKLFTHSHFEENEEYETQKKNLPKTPLKSQTDLNVLRKKDSDKKKDFRKTPIVPGKALKVFGSTPKDIGKSPKVSNALIKTPSLIDNALSKKEALKRFSKYSFLKSLDAEANKVLCDADALYYRENYKTKKHELADKLFKLYNDKVFNSQLSDVPIKWNKKLQTTGGRCNNSRRAGIRNSLVELSDKVLTSADRLRCTLIHEMCHAAAWIMSGENGHGATWKKWTSKANSIFPELPKITVCHSYVIEYKYTYLCTDCKARSQAHSKTKKVEEVRCSLCKGNIQLFQNKKNKDGVLELIPVQRKEPTAFAKFVKLKFKEVKKPNMSHKEVMQMLSAQFSSLAVEEKAQL